MFYAIFLIAVMGQNPNERLGFDDFRLVGSLIAPSFEEKSISKLKEEKCDDLIMSHYATEYDVTRPKQWYFIDRCGVKTRVWGWKNPNGSVSFILDEQKWSKNEKSSLKH